MKILISSGSFKDVFSSAEACEMIKGILPESAVCSVQPVCDGGEYTFDILRSFYGGKARVINVRNVINPYGRPVDVSYLAVDNAAFVVSSEILHLSLEEDEYKNPLELSDFGLGQLIADAIEKGFRDIRLCLGGTSTVGYGIGVAQALGAELSGYDSEKPICPADFHEITSIDFHPERFRDIKLSVINDGITRACDLDIVTPLKVGLAFASEKASILKRIDEECDNIYKVTGLTVNDPWSGNAGGVYFGVQNMFSCEYFKGSDYFCDLFGLNEKIAQSDLVITGEGRFDNPRLKKIPVTVCERAKAQGKPVIFMCGQIAPEWAEIAENPAEGVYIIPELKEQYSIEKILSCTDYYESRNIPASPEVFKEYTPIILKERLSSCQTCFH